MDNLFELVKKYFHGEATLSERVKLMDWVEESETNREEFESLRRMYDTALMKDSEKEAIRSKRIRLNWKWSAAAAVAVIAGIFIARISDLKPDKDFVCQTIEAPVGQRIRTVLSDSTVVWLNSGSKITISQFSRKERRVHLTGEAFWDVAKDPDRPFIVETSQLEVKVLGTRFNVDAYSKVQAVVLVSGSVNIEDYKKGNSNTLVPNQKFTLDSESGSQDISNVNAEDFVTWTTGYLQFDDEPLAMVFDRLCQLYGTEIIYDRASLTGYAINGKLRIYDDIESALEFIKLMVPISYKSAGEHKVRIILQ